MKNPLAFTLGLLCTFLFLFPNYLQAQNPGPPSGNGIVPVVVAGNPDCENLGFNEDGDFSYKPQPEPPPTGTYPFPGDPISELYLVSDGTYFDWNSSLKLNAVIVKGGNNANVYYYTPAAYSDTDLHSPINPNNDQPYGISHIEVCYDYSLDIIVVDPPTTSFKRTYDWDINKSVTPDSWSFFKGDKGTSEYTVAVVKDEGTDSDWAVEGLIRIENNTPFDATVESIENMISGIGMVGPDCGGISFPYVLTAGESLECSYSSYLPDGTSRINTTTVTTSGIVGGGSDSEDIVFGDPATEVNAEVNVEDTNGMSWGPVDENSSWTYPKTFTCGEDKTYGNSATIVETDEDASASVKVTCYELEVEKNVATALTRTWNWTIGKSNGDSELTLSEGQSYTTNYKIELDATSSDSDWSANGTITINNPHPSLDAELNHVEDMLTGDINAVVVCNEDIVPAGGLIECSYSVALPNADARTNKATAILQNKSYDKNGNATEDGETGFEGIAQVDFSGATIEEIDEQIEVSDPLAPSNPLGNISRADQLPFSFSYDYIIGPLDCSLDPHESTLTNTASFVTNDRGIEGSDQLNILIHLACGEGCTLTQGYWKTHSEHGPAPYDDNWANVGPLQQDEIFFLSNQTYYEVLWTPPAGNPYYVLARQYIAAYLNVLNGASVHGDVAASMSWAVIFFNTNTPTDTDGLKGKAKKDIVKNASTLDQYNNGLLGPGHCDEDGKSGDGNRFGESISLDEDIFVIYPNPAEQEVFIDISLLHSVKGNLIMSDQLGRVVYQSKLNDLDDLIIRIDLREYGIRPGFYFLSLETKKGQYVEKLMVVSKE